MPIRVQLTSYDTLVGEVIVEDYAEANKLWSAYACAKYRKGDTTGAVVMSDVKQPRFFDVRVGEAI